MWSPLGATNSFATFATVSFVDVYRAEPKYHSLFSRIGPPAAALKFCKCAIPLELRTFRDRRKSSRSSPRQLQPEPPRNTPPLNYFPPSSRIRVHRTPPP